jgi:hypothetical protein
MEPLKIDREAMDILFGDKVCMIEGQKYPAGGPHFVHKCMAHTENAH